VKAGDRLGPITVAVDAGPMKTVAALIDDPTPIHFDVRATKAYGLGDRVVNQGPVTMSYLLNVLLLVPDVTIERCSVRLVGNVLDGDRVVCEGTVTAVDDDGRVRVDLRAHVAGRPVATAEAVLEPDRPAD
jgi:3-hydroxybutyryl-CoA dehydratase